jgi:hypothetical protein
MLGTGSVSDFGFWNTCILKWDSLGKPNRNAKSIYVSYTAYVYIGFIYGIITNWALNLCTRTYIRTALCSSWEGTSEAAEEPGSGRVGDEEALRCSTQGMWGPATPCLGTPQPSGIFHVWRYFGAQEVSDFGGFRISEFRIRDTQPVIWILQITSIK